MLKKIRNLIVLICIFLSLISISNISFAAPGRFYPKEYNIILFTIGKKDIEKIEIFTPWGNFDDDNKIEIDGRLFNYNNQYYGGPDEDSEYNGIKCKILKTISKDKIKSFKNGIYFNISTKNEITNFYLKIYLKNNSVVYSDYICSYTIIDEFSSENEIKEAEKIKNKKVYWVGDFENRDPWIEMYESDIKMNSNFDIAKIFSCCLVIIFLLIILMKIYKNNKSLKIIILTLIICGVVSPIVLLLNNKTSSKNEEQLKIYVKEQNEKNEKAKQEFRERKRKAKEEKEKEEKESEIIKIKLVDMSLDKKYNWKNNTAYMIYKPIRIKDYSNNSNELYNIVYFSTEFFENFFYGSFYNQKNHIFYFYKDQHAYVKANDRYYYEDTTKFNLVQNLDLKTIVKEGKLYIPLPLYRQNFLTGKCFGFDKETNTIYYYGERMGLPTNYSFTQFDDNIKLKEKILNHKDFYYNSNKFSNDSSYYTLEYMIDHKDGVYSFYTAEVGGKSCIIRLYYRYNSNTHDYHYDKYKIIE